MGLPGGGGSSNGKLWNFGRTDRVPLTGMVARRGAKAVSCSLLGTLLVFGLAAGASLNPGKGLS